MMIDTGNIKKIHFLGIGGIGMSALARYFRLKGISISGYDRTPSVITDELSREGMAIHFNDDPGLIPADTDIAIYTPAIPKSLEEFRYLQTSGIPLVKRAQVTGMITEGKTVVAIAGTHGKTSISSLAAHILVNAGYPATALIGGISKNFNSNFITSGREEIMVVEADEYDRSFLHLHPDIAVISAIDPDHLDIYGSEHELHRSFNDFAANIKENGCLVMRKGLRVDLMPDTGLVTYASDEEALISATNLHIDAGKQLFDLVINTEIHPGIRLQVPGRHNVENALAATAVCYRLGVPVDRIISGILTFTGVRRRFDIRYEDDKTVYIDDYAHHPRELEAFITAVRSLYPDKKLTGLFQPHLYSRTRDFAEGFARSLDLLDEAWLLDIYPARELPIPGVTSQLILSQMKLANKKAVTSAEALHLVEIYKPEVLLTIGAGDIDLLAEPLINFLQS